MPDEVMLRPFVAADQAAVRSLILSGLGEHFGHVDETLNPDLDDIAASYLARGAVFLVAERDGRLIGTGALVPGKDGTGQIVRVSVAPDARRHGIARRIVARLIAMAAARGLTRLLVETNRDWHAAIALYERCGFVRAWEDTVSVYLIRHVERSDAQARGPYTA